MTECETCINTQENECHGLWRYSARYSSVVSCYWLDSEVVHSLIFLTIVTLKAISLTISWRLQMIVPWVLGRLVISRISNIMTNCVKHSSLWAPIQQRDTCQNVLWISIMLQLNVWKAGYETCSAYDIVDVKPVNAQMAESIKSLIFQGYRYHENIS